MLPAVGRPELRIEINRQTPPPKFFPFTDYFKGFEKVQAVRSVFGEETEKVLGDLKIGFISLKYMYMGIRDEDGSISVGTYHLKHSDLRTLYLDIIHELFHIRQWQEDKKYFEEEHRKFMGNWSLYYASPIEVPAYRHTVREAERIGMRRGEIIEHLKMGPTSQKAFAKFLKAMELGHGPKSERKVTLPVRINRRASITLFLFRDYFKGFEKVAAVRTLFGKRVEQVLNNLKVEFIHGSFMQVVPSDEDGHLLVSVPYLKKSDLDSIYLDILFCLNLKKRFYGPHKTSRVSREGFGEDQAVLESYRAMLDEARRLQVPPAKIMEHLNLPRFLMSPVGYKRFLRRLGLLGPSKKSSE